MNLGAAEKVDFGFGLVDVDLSLKCVEEREVLGTKGGIWEMLYTSG